MNELAQIAAIKAQTLARIAEMTAAPKPSYTIDGQNVAWSEYLGRLQQTVDWCDARTASAVPLELRSQAGT